MIQHDSPPHGWTYANIGFQEMWGWAHAAVAYLVVHDFASDEWSASVKDLYTGRVEVFPDHIGSLAEGIALCKSKFNQAKS